jgi:hypothetical protein
MSKCYIPEVSIRTIRKVENINKLKDKFEYNEIKKEIVCVTDGFYEITDKSLIKYKNVLINDLIFENFVDDYTLLVSNSYEKKIGQVEFIPFESEQITISYLIFDIPESNNKLVFKYFNKRITDFYFQTREKITQNNIFLNNDVSLILKTLNV